MNKLALVAAFALAVVSCTKDNNPDPDPVDPEAGPVKGLFLLNEGAMGANKASLDYFNFETGAYVKDVFKQKNPTIVQGLGDVGNDIQIYGNKVYIVVNGSNLVEIIDLQTGAHLGSVTVPQCRNVAFHNGYAYVSAYAGKTAGSDQYGFVSQIDTVSLTQVKTVDVGKNPEQIVACNGKIYVVNSGWGADNTLSVINPATMTVEKTVEIVANMTKIAADESGLLWIISNGDYMTIPASIYTYDPVSSTSNNMNIPAANMTICGDSLYFYNSAYDPVTWAATYNYGIINVKSKAQVANNIITDGSESNLVNPYCLAVNPTTRDIYVTDAKDYTVPGTITCYSKLGVKKWERTVGDIPGHIAFTKKALN